MKTLLLSFLFVWLSIASFAASYEVVEENNKKGLKNDKGELIIPMMYDDLGWSKDYPVVLQDVLGYKKGHLWGLINIRNQKISDPIYASIYPAGSRSIIASRFNTSNNEMRFGLIDLKGAVLVSFIYYSLECQDEYLVASIYKNGLSYGLITNREKTLVPIQYQNVYRLLPHIYQIRNFENKNAYFNARTRTIGAFSYDTIYSYNDRYLIIVEGGRHGIMDKEGNILISPSFKEVTKSDDRTLNALPFTKWHVIDGNNKELQSFNFDEIQPIGNKVSKVIAGDNEGLIDSSGKLLTKLQPCRIGQFQSNHAIISKEGKYGAIDYDGNLVLPVEFDSVIIGDNYFFANTLLNRKPHWTIHDFSGKAITGPGYHEAMKLDDGLFAVRTGIYWGLISSDGEIITTCKFDTLSRQEDGSIQAVYLKQRGVLDRKGEWSIVPKYYKLIHVNTDTYIASDPFCNSAIKKSEAIVYCSNGDIVKRKNDLLEIRNDGKMGLLSFNGRVYLDARYDYISELQNDSVYVFKKEGEYGIMTKSGRILTDGNKFEEVYPQSEDFLGVKINGKFGFIDANGKLRIANRYDSIGRFSEGLAAIKLIGKWGFIDKQERLKVQPRYEKVDEFQNGLALVHMNGKYGLVNAGDKLVLPAEYDKLEKMQSGRYISYKSGKYGLIGRDGKELVFPKYEEIRELDNGNLIIQRRGKYGMSTENGVMIIPFMYETIIYDSQNDVYLAAEKAEWKSFQLPE